MRRTIALLVPILLALPACVGNLAYGGDRIHEHVHNALPANGARSIVIENVAGPVTVSASATSTVSIDATKSANDSDAIDRTHIDVTRDGDQIRIQTRYDEQGSSWFSHHNGASVAYDVRVPANVDVEIRNVSGSVTTGGTTGDVSIEEVSGPVRASLGRVNASRHITVHSVSGSIDVTMTKDSDVRVEGRTVSGGIHAFFPGEIHKGFVGESLDGRVGSGSASMSLAAVSGAITIAPQE